VRIIVLVTGGWPADHPFHELAGLACVLIYVWLPLAIAVKYLNRSGHSSSSEIQKVPNALKFKALPWKQGLFYSLAVGIVAFICVRQSIDNQLSYPTISVKGYKETLLPKGIKQLKNAHSLVYLKNIPTFYSVEHSPYVCWQGSGYEFRNVQEIRVQKKRMYKATMTMGNQRLYTAWWFSGDDLQTNSQLIFRWQMLWNKKNFHLVNVTTEQEAALEEAIKQMLNTDVLSI
jgi:exosortase N